MNRSIRTDTVVQPAPGYFFALGATAAIGASFTIN